MQIDVQQTHKTPLTLCPLCNKPLKNGGSTCYSCGFFSEPSPGSRSSVQIDSTVRQGSALSDAFQSSLSSEHRGASDRGAHRDEQGQTRRQPNPITPIPSRA